MNFILETKQYSEVMTALARTEPFWQLSKVNLDEDVKMTFLTQEKFLQKRMYIFNLNLQSESEMIRYKLWSRLFGSDKLERLCR